ncbi:MAG: hypothetical protein NVS3B16_05770 [Vulcanimicrobiaceae bacterium]
MGYGPNVDAALWFARTVWPLVRERSPQARLRLAGAAPTAAVRALAGPDIDVTGAVPDVNAALRSATVAVCPMRTGTGVRGVGGVPGRDLLVADDASGIADAVLGLFADAGRRAALAAAGRRLMETAYDWDVHARALEAVYARAVTAS